jgi:hypothetical protein
MNKWIANITFILLLSSCMEDSPYSNSPERSISIKTESKYRFDNNLRSIVYIKEFSENGLLIKYTRFNEDNISKISEYKYKENKKIEKVTEFTDNKEVNKTIEYIKNEDGKVSEIQKFDDFGNLIENSLFEYDSDGRVVKKTDLLTITADSNLIYQYDYVLDDNGRINSITVINQLDEKVKTDSLIYKTDEITKLTINESGEIERKTVISYDRAGNLEEEIVFDSNNEITSRYFYVYTFFD